MAESKDDRRTKSFERTVKDVVETSARMGKYATEDQVRKYLRPIAERVDVDQAARDRKGRK